MKDLYKNPFGGVNAVQLTEEKILEYWCNPFRYNLYAEIKEEDVYNDEMNIVIMGGRSTGKSMLLRYWSFPVQMKIAEKEEISFSKKIEINNGIGFYFRIDGPKLKSFVGNDLPIEHWSALFTHYLELLIGRKYLEVLSYLEEEKKENWIDLKTLKKLCALINFEQNEQLSSVLVEFDEKIKEVENYLGNVPFYKNQFVPKSSAYLSQSLSFEIPQFLARELPFFKDINFAILLDEYENFLDYQQKIVNTLLRFTQHNIKFRIGMRLEGFRTYTMISQDDFIKVGREYREVVLEEIVNVKNDSGYTDFLIEVSKKRLESVPILLEKKFTDIRSLLMERENVEKDAIELVKGRENLILKHFSGKGVSVNDLEKVICPQNPLLEILNCIQLVRGKKADEVKQAMENYLNDVKTTESQKYQRDYIDKYKLSLSFLLYSIYRASKPYYSFNTFAFLSSGIVGHFIELCRIAFDEAGWGGNDKLIGEGLIGKEFQSKAALKLSSIEKRQINRIEIYGNSISKFVENLGNIFRHFHLDYRIRYPETNQFAFSIDNVKNDKHREALMAAIKWTVIQRKPRMQRSGPGESLQDIYTINRIYSPIFQISYRTRGGKSVKLNDNQIDNLMTHDKINYNDYLPNDDSNSTKSDNTLTLFPDL